MLKKQNWEGPKGVAVALLSFFFAVKLVKVNLLCDGHSEHLEDEKRRGNIVTDLADT